MPYHLAQLNVARMLAPLDDPVMQDFVDNIDRINELAEQSDGFIWRLKDEDGDDATGLRIENQDTLLVNMSVWRDLESLKKYVYHSDHRDIMIRKKEWFSKMDQMHVVLWYVKAGHLPDLEEARQKLEHLHQHGESPDAFSFRKTFSPNI